MRHFATATAIAALIAAVPAAAQQQGSAQPQQEQQQQAQPSQGQQQDQVAQQDKTFAEDAYVGNQLEIRLGEIAMQQAESQQVKDFGQQMMNDHGAAQAKLNPIISDLSIEAPTGLPQDAQQTAEDLQGKQGQEFDQAYMQKMVEDHQKAVDLYKKQAEQGQNQELKSYAEDTVPTLEEHLQKARDISQQAGAMAQSGQPGQPQEQQQAQGGQQRQEPSAMEGAGQGAEQAGKSAAQTAEQAGQGAMQTTEQTAGQATQQGEQTARLPNLEGIVGTSVYGQNDQEIGEVSEVLMDQQGKVERVVIDQGGFLGIGEKEVAVELEKLQMQENRLMLNMTDQQLAEMPEYKAE